MRNSILCAALVLLVFSGNDGKAFGQELPNLPKVASTAGQSTWSPLEQGQWPLALQYAMEVARLTRHKIEMPASSPATIQVLLPTQNQRQVDPRYAGKQGWEKDPKPTWGGVLILWQNGGVTWAGIIAYDAPDSIPLRDGGRSYKIGYREGWPRKNDFPVIGSWRGLSVPDNDRAAGRPACDPYEMQKQAAATNLQISEKFKVLENIRWKGEKR